MDSAFESSHGSGWHIYSPLSTHDADFGFSIVLHQQPRNMFMIFSETDDKLYLKTYQKSGCKFEVTSVTNAGSSGNMFVTLVDELSSEFYIF